MSGYNRALAQKNTKDSLYPERDNLFFSSIIIISSGHIHLDAALSVSDYVRLSIALVGRLVHLAPVCCIII